MYHTPNLTGLRKKYIPKRFNEGWGLQHMKLYGCDDEIIMSGANLSSDYFTNRQDRYHLFKSKDITKYFFNVHQAVASLSFRVVPSPDTPAQYSLVWPESNPAPNVLDDPKGYIAAATRVLSPIIHPSSVTKALGASTKSDPSFAPVSCSYNVPDTTVYPLSQFTQLLKPDTSTELPALTSILRILGSPALENSKWTFTAGYFNPDASLKKLLIDSRSQGTIITASKWANGFFGASGPAGLLPGAYILYSRRFMDAARKAGRDGAIRLLEWRRGTVGVADGWTYHAKGLWVTLPHEQEPSMTLVGSSNYTKRSYNLDLESNCLVVTRNKELKQQLRDEEERLQEYTSEVKKEDFEHVDRRVDAKTRIAMWMVKLAGGAL
jgi:CDP-diacylglycerol--glycerol-3-phosphate 3-phosphatidyltransferase